MSEETQNDGTWSGLKKTIIGTLGTAILGLGTWFTTTFLGANNEAKEEIKTEQPATNQAGAPVIINLQNNNTQQQSNTGSGTTIIKERVIEKEKHVTPTPKPKKKEGDEFKEKEPQW
jgi:hypothetical protein